MSDSSETANEENVVETPVLSKSNLDVSQPANESSDLPKHQKQVQSSNSNQESHTTQYYPMPPIHQQRRQGIPYNSYEQVHNLPQQTTYYSVPYEHSQQVVRQQSHQQLQSQFGNARFWNTGLQGQAAHMMPQTQKDNINMPYPVQHFTAPSVVQQPYQQQMAPHYQSQMTQSYQPQYVPQYPSQIARRYRPSMASQNPPYQPQMPHYYPNNQPVSQQGSQGQFNQGFTPAHPQQIAPSSQQAASILTEAVAPQQGNYGFMHQEQTPLFHQQSYSTDDVSNRMRGEQPLNRRSSARIPPKKILYAGYCYTRTVPMPLAHTSISCVSADPPGFKEESNISADAQFTVTPTNNVQENSPGITEVSNINVEPQPETKVSFDPTEKKLPPSAEKSNESVGEKTTNDVPSKEERKENETHLQNTYASVVGSLKLEPPIFASSTTNVVTSTQIPSTSAAQPRQPDGKKYSPNLEIKRTPIVQDGKDHDEGNQKKHHRAAQVVCQNSAEWKVVQSGKGKPSLSQKVTGSTSLVRESSSRPVDVAGSAEEQKKPLFPPTTTKNLPKKLKPRMSSPPPLPEPETVLSKSQTRRRRLQQKKKGQKENCDPSDANIVDNSDEQTLLKNHEDQINKAIETYWRTRSDKRHAHFCNQSSHRFKFSGLEKEIVKYWDDRSLVGLSKQRETERVDAFVNKRISFYGQTANIHHKKMIQFYTILNVNHCAVVTEDLIWLISKNKTTRAIEIVEEQYYKMVIEHSFTENHEPAYKTIEDEDIDSIDVPFDRQYLQHFRNYVNRQFEHRYKLGDKTIVVDTNVCPSLEIHMNNLFQNVEFNEDPEWCADATKEVFNCRLRYLMRETPSEKMLLFVQFYEFLLTWPSAILDFNSFVFYEEFDKRDYDERRRINSDARFFHVVFGYRLR